MWNPASGAGARVPSWPSASHWGGPQAQGTLIPMMGWIPAAFRPGGDAISKTRDRKQTGPWLPGDTGPALQAVHLL